VLAYLDERLVGHAVATIRWLQAGNGPLLCTAAYVDAVATSPTDHGRGIGGAVMRHLSSGVDDCDIACLETDRVAFYERLGWEQWRAPGRPVRGGVHSDAGPERHHDPPTCRTPNLDLRQLLTIEAHRARIW
jgi:GNAT superfamily N-acetyltransferase